MLNLFPTEENFEPCSLIIWINMVNRWYDNRKAPTSESSPSVLFRESHPTLPCHPIWGFYLNFITMFHFREAVRAMHASHTRSTEGPVRNRVQALWSRVRSRFEFGFILVKWVLRARRELSDLTPSENFPPLHSLPNLRTLFTLKWLTLSTVFSLVYSARFPPFNSAGLYKSLLLLVVSLCRFLMILCFMTSRCLISLTLCVFVFLRFVKHHQNEVQRSIMVMFLFKNIESFLNLYPK